MLKLLNHSNVKKSPLLSEAPGSWAASSLLPYRVAGTLTHDTSLIIGEVPFFDVHVLRKRETRGVDSDAKLTEPWNVYGPDYPSFA